MRLIDADLLEPDADYDDGEYWAISMAQIQSAPTITPERKRGRWLEKKVVHAINDGCITEWQSCKCSECGRYDTRPYMYYFDEPNFCSCCGAEMKGE